MSHFTKLKTAFRDLDCLVDALIDMGLTREQIEVHETAQSLHGYLGDVRPEIAEVIIRRKHVGRSSNDVGFKLETQTPIDAQGNVTHQTGFTAIISEYDRGKNYGKQWMGKLKQNYAARAIQKVARKRRLPCKVTKTGSKVEVQVRMR